MSTSNPYAQPRAHVPDHPVAIAEEDLNDAAAVNSAVWTRGTIVVVSALLTYAFTVRAARGSRRAYLRLRIISAVMVVAIAVHHRASRHLPLWMKIEQGVSRYVDGRTADERGWL